MAAPASADGASFPTAGTSRAADWLRDLRYVPREQTLAHLAYRLKQPVFALPVYRYSLTGAVATALRITPSDPWPGNAERGAALLHGEFTFAGRQMVNPAPLWTPIGADSEWREELHGFAWLRDLRAAGGDAVRRRARDLVGDWLRENRDWNAVAWAPLASGRRLDSWLANYEFFAASAEIHFRHRLLRSIARQARHLQRVLPAGLAGGDLIGAVKGLVVAGVCLPNGDPWRRRGLALLRRELRRQILSDGGHIERNPARHMAVLRDLIDLRALLHKGASLAGEGDVPVELHEAIEAMAPALRLFQHGDGGLARFNGATEEEGWQVDMVVQRAGARRRPLADAPDSGFQRLRAGRLTALIDCGSPPPRGLDHAAHAGTFGLEVSVGRERLIVNCGARAGDPAWLQAQRSTAAHSTLTLDDTNSSETRSGGGFGRRARVGPYHRDEADGNSWLDVVHDGYARAKGVVHRRRLYLAADGADLRGEDSLEPSGGTTPRGSFAVRFHLHPTVRASLAQSGDNVLLRLPRGGGWQFRASGARISLESSVYIGPGGEPRRTQQVVLRGEVARHGACAKWALKRVERKRG